jgi:ABC-type branched-subunit amino acid transport system substrate-binding protein
MGHWLTVTLRLVAGLFLIVASGCALVGPSPDRPEATPLSGALLPAGVAIEPGGEEERREVLALDLLRRAELALDAGEWARARSLAGEVITQYPRARGSALALWIEGVGARELGDRIASVEALFRIPTDADARLRERALSLARTLAADLSEPELRDLVDEAPAHPWILPPFLVAYGERRAAVGDAAGARGAADRARSLAPDEAEADALARLAERLGGGAEGRPFPGVSLALLISEEGSPGLAQLSREIRAGVEVALLAEGVRGRVQLVVLEDGGDASRTRRAVESLRSTPVVGLLGPLTDGALVSGLSAGGAGLPLVSPTVRLTPRAAADVYSIGGVDPEASRVLAELVWADGVRDVVVFHRRDAEEELELETFRVAFEALGGRIRQTFSYLPGATTFEQPMQAIRRAAPAALVLFTPPEDAELVAPQLSFYGVEGLPGLRRYGGSSWGSRGVLELLPARHTEGMRTVSANPAGGVGPAWDAFVLAYESHFQRSLRSPGPALGWDAARLLLEAVRLGGDSAAGVARGLREIRGLDGATGQFMWKDGRISRRFYPVEVRDRQLHPLMR